MTALFFMGGILELAAVVGAASAIFATIFKIFDSIRKVENHQQLTDGRQDEAIAYLKGRVEEQGKMIVEMFKKEYPGGE